MADRRGRPSKVTYPVNASNIQMGEPVFAPRQVLGAAHRHLHLRE